MTSELIYKRKATTIFFVAACSILEFLQLCFVGIR